MSALTLTGNKYVWTRATIKNQGDIVTIPGDSLGGYFVVLLTHISGKNPPVPGESSINYHYSFGPAGNGKM